MNGHDRQTDSREGQPVELYIARTSCYDHTLRYSYPKNYPSLVNNVTFRYIYYAVTKKLYLYPFKQIVFNIILRHIIHEIYYIY